MKKLLLLGVAVVVVCVRLIQSGELPLNAVHGNGFRGDEVLARAFENRDSNLQVEGQGIVIKVLPDDLDGSQHQRFIIQLNSGQTLLLAHNIELAPRVLSLSDGDEVMFNGEYEWTSQGGVIHWTHRDPDGHHPAGWIKHEGRTYQ